MRIIGLTGRAGAGKDTVANFIVDEFAGKDAIVYTLRFAGALKRGIADMFQLTHEHIEGDLKEVALPDIGVSPRRLMQTLGTDWGRDMIHPDIWVFAMRRWLEANVAFAQRSGYESVVVIPDVRFENEAELIRSMGGEIWHIDRPSPKLPFFASLKAWWKARWLHKSEAGVRHYQSDLTIVNNDTPEHFKECVIAAYRYGRYTKP